MAMLVLDRAGDLSVLATCVIRACKQLQVPSSCAVCATVRCILWGARGRGHSRGGVSRAARVEAACCYGTPRGPPQVGSF